LPTTLVQNDNRPDQPFTIYDDTGTVVNLTGCTVKFFFRNDNSHIVVNLAHATMTLTDAANGIVKYVWDNHAPLAPFDLATAGEYTAEIEVTFPDGTVETVRDTFAYHVRQEVETTV